MTRAQLTLDLPLSKPVILKLPAPKGRKPVSGGLQTHGHSQQNNIFKNGKYKAEIVRNRWPYFVNSLEKLHREIRGALGACLHEYVGDPIRQIYTLLDSANASGLQALQPRWMMIYREHAEHMSNRWPHKEELSVLKRQMAKARLSKVAGEEKRLDALQYQIDVIDGLMHLNEMRKDDLDTYRKERESWEMEPEGSAKRFISGLEKLKQ